MNSSQNEIDILSVSQLNAAARQIIEENFPSIWVEGEISNLSLPASGHIYFSLKDQNSQIRCAFFRGKNKLINFNPKDGMHILVKANASLYEGRGDFQLIIQQMELAGSGALRLQFEMLKTKLASENLFDSLHKKIIPKMPRTIGIVTSPTGAAIRDILITLRRRYPSAAIIIYPCQVQGTTAAKQIIAALQLANSRKEVDILILTRGGGSLEDLWCFNDENLAREIFKLDIPLVTGIGHEIDFTIADFVSDVRAATPTAAAELVSPNQDQWLEELDTKRNRIIQCMQHKFKLISLELLHITKQLKHPGQIIRERQQTLDFSEQKIVALIQKTIKHHQSILAELKINLKHTNPGKLIQQKIQLLTQVFLRLSELNKAAIREKYQALENLMRALNNVSPLATLERGYTISRQPSSKQIVRSIKQLELNQRLELMFVDGNAECEITKV